MAETDAELGTIKRAGGSFEARLERFLEHDQKAVWTMLTDPARLPEWLAPGELSSKKGGPAKLNFPESGTVIDSVVSAIEAPRLIEYSWSGPGEPERPVRWETAAENGGTRLTLTLRIPDTEDIARSCAGWEAHLQMLLAAIEENAAFQLWRADQPVFNVPTFSTGFAGPTPAAIAHLAAGESATIEFLSNNLIFSNGIQCSGKLYSSTGELSPLQTSGVDAGKPNSIQVTINSGLNFRRDDWPILYSGSVAARLTATPNSQMRIYFPSPQKNASGRIIKFERWSDGSTDNPRTFTLGGQDVSYTYVTTTLPSDTPIGTDLYGGDFSSPPDTAVTTSYLQPYEISAGTAEPSVIVNGTGLRKGWVGLWNGQPRPTQYLNSYQLRVMLLAEDVESPSSVGFRFVIPSAMRSSG